jgi:uncharacterized protein YukE
MVDTLKLARRLQDAGLERPVAEAMAEAFAETTVETVATKQDLREQVGVLRAEIEGTADRLNARMDGLAGTLRAEIQGTSDRLNGNMDGLAKSLDARMDGLAGTLRAEMQALRWQVIGAVALMLLVHLGAVWGIVAVHAP